jgi:hypothetical protein
MLPGPPGGIVSSVIVHAPAGVAASAHGPPE